MTNSNRVEPEHLWCGSCEIWVAPGNARYDVEDGDYRHNVRGCSSFEKYGGYVLQAYPPQLPLLVAGKEPHRIGEQRGVYRQMVFAALGAMSVPTSASAEIQTRGPAQAEEYLVDLLNQMDEDTWA